MVRIVIGDLEDENLNAGGFAENHSKDRSVPPPSTEAEEGNRESRALMEKNATGRTYEWEDSVDVTGTSSCSERCRLPSPKVTYVSPLKVPELKKWTRKRKRRMWSPEEEQALHDGVVKHGKSWSLILSSNPGVFVNRTSVDLKDKWRNMRK